MVAGKKCARLHSKYADATQKKSCTSDQSMACIIGLVLLAMNSAAK